MSQIYNTGPVELYTGTTDDGSLEFLGYSEDGMEINLRETFEDVHSDLLGPKIPTDVQHFQADALITGTLIRWNNSVLKACEDRSQDFIGTQISGTVGWGLIAKVENGALMLAQGKCYRLLCDAPNTGLPVFPNLDPYNFHSVYLHDVMTRKRGARVERVRVAFRALANYTNIGATATLPQTRLLYDADRTGRPAFSPN